MSAIKQMPRIICLLLVQHRPLFGSDHTKLRKKIFREKMSIIQSVNYFKSKTICYRSDDERVSQNLKITDFFDSNPNVDNKKNHKQDKRLDFIKCDIIESEN